MNIKSLFHDVQCIDTELLFLCRSFLPELMAMSPVKNMLV